MPIGAAIAPARTGCRRDVRAGGTERQTSAASANVFLPASICAFSNAVQAPTGITVTHAHEHGPQEADRLTAEEVGARVSAILGAAEREAREIIASAHRETPSAAAVPSGATIDDLARALERLSARFDAFELATAARVEELGRELRSAVPAGEPVAEAPVPPAPAPAPEDLAATASEDSAHAGAARVRAIDLALAGWEREAIANELSVSMPRSDVEALLDHVLAS
jgi:hypothetical protein